MNKPDLIENDILRAAMKETGTTQVKLSELLGYSAQSAISGTLHSPRMSVEKFVELLCMMGYEVVVRDHYDRGGSEWRVKVKGHEWPETTEIAVVKAPGEDL